MISDQLCEYYGLITHLDKQVGRILSALKKSGHADNTIVVYTADHGLAMGSHGLLGKQNVYEQSMQCPLILRGPGIPKGKSSEAFTYVHDLYATLCNLADVEPENKIDSEDLTEIIRGNSKEVRKSLFLPFQDNQRSVNDGKWKLHIYPQINHRLLFNLEEDPHEIKDLAQNQNFSKQQKRMEQLMIAWRTNLKDPYPLQSEKQLPFKPSYNNNTRTLDRWQPKWIREKYFDGRNDPDHGKK
jgi:arylsulfatase A-like enzyme